MSFSDVEVGNRPYYLTDPDGGVRDYRTWLQRTVTSIENVREGGLPDD